MRPSRSTIVACVRWSKPAGVGTHWKPNSAAIALSVSGEGVAKVQRGSPIPCFLANSRIAIGESNGRLKPMVSTWKASSPTALRPLSTASARNLVVVGQTWKQPV